MAERALTAMIHMIVRGAHLHKHHEDEEDHEAGG